MQDVLADFSSLLGRYYQELVHVSSDDIRAAQASVLARASELLLADSRSHHVPACVFSAGKRIDALLASPSGLYPQYVQVYPAGGLSLLGGKGGFAANLKRESKTGFARKVLDFGACRDLNGRRLRHVNNEIRLRRWASPEEQGRRKALGGSYTEARGDAGIDGWFLGTPSWLDAVGGSKGRGEGVRAREQRREAKLLRQRDREAEWAQTKREERKAARRRAEDSYVQAAAAGMERGGDLWPGGRSGSSRNPWDSESNSRDHEGHAASRAVMTGLRASAGAATAVAASARQLQEQGTSTRHDEDRGLLFIEGLAGFGIDSQDLGAGASADTSGATVAHGGGSNGEGGGEGGMAGWLVSLAGEGDVDVRFGAWEADPGASHGGATAATGGGGDVGRGSKAGSKAGSDASKMQTQTRAEAEIESGVSIGSVAEVHATGEFPSVWVESCGARRGCWYFEVTSLTGGLCQVGWSGEQFPTEAVSGDGVGVGDGEASAGFDAARGQALAGGRSVNFGRPWKAGEVVGVWADLTGIETGRGARLGVSIQGKWQGWMPSTSLTALGKDSPGNKIRPALSLEAGEAVMVNLGMAPFAHPPQADISRDTRASHGGAQVSGPSNAHVFWPVSMCVGGGDAEWLPVHPSSVGVAGSDAEGYAEGEGDAEDNAEGEDDGGGNADGEDGGSGSSNPIQGTPSGSTSMPPSMVAGRKRSMPSPSPKDAPAETRSASASGAIADAGTGAGLVAIPGVLQGSLGPSLVLHGRAGQGPATGTGSGSPSDTGSQPPSKRSRHEEVVLGEAGESVHDEALGESSSSSSQAVDAGHVSLVDLLAYHANESRGGPMVLLDALGGDRLKEQLRARGLKCGGTPLARAHRLWAVRGLQPDEVPGKLRAKVAPAMT